MITPGASVVRTCRVDESCTANVIARTSHIAIAHLHNGQLMLEDNKPGLLTVLVLPVHARRERAPSEAPLRPAPATVDK